jgi:hypothetical protein
MFSELYASRYASLHPCAIEDGDAERLLLDCQPSLLTGVLTDPAFGWPLYGLPLVVLVPVLVPVLSPTTVSFGLSVIVTSALRWAIGLLHIQPLPDPRPQRVALD